MNNTIVIYKTKYGSTGSYAQWIAEDLGCKTVNTKDIKADGILQYDTIQL